MIESGSSEEPSIQERIVFSALLLVLSALALFGLIIKSSEPVLERMWVLLGVLISFVALLAMLVFASELETSRKQGLHPQ